MRQQVPSTQQVLVQVLPLAHQVVVVVAATKARQERPSLAADVKNAASNIAKPLIVVWLAVVAVVAVVAVLVDYY
jgi:putative copper export protein